MRKPIKTKEMYVVEVASLSDRLNNALTEDKRLRDEFSQLLGIERPTMWSGQSSIQRMSWEEIFFRIGELKSDAEYTCLLERWRTCRAELDAIKQTKNKES